MYNKLTSYNQKLQNIKLRTLKCLIGTLFSFISQILIKKKKKNPLFAKQIYRAPSMGLGVF